MSVSGHLRDLRRRLVLSLLGITLGAVGGWFLYEPVMAHITAPLMDMQDAGTQINFPTIGAALDLKLRVSIWIGLIILSPWWIYQLGAFIIPGLKRKERMYAFAFGAVGVLLFAGGATTGVWLVPRAVEILQSFVPPGGVSLLQADTYVDFYLRLVLLFGVSFLIPEVLVALNFLGVLSARNMLRAWRWAVLVAFIFAAIANPLPSPWPMIMQALILVALYLLAVLVSWVNERYRAYGPRLRPPKNPPAHGAGGATASPNEAGPKGGPEGQSNLRGGGYSGKTVSPAEAERIVPSSPHGSVPVAFAAGVAVPGTMPVPMKASGAEDSAANPVGNAAENPEAWRTVTPTMSVRSEHSPSVKAAPAAAATVASGAGPDTGYAAQPRQSTEGTHLLGVIVLAGGTAERMGGISKPDVVVGGKTMLVRAIEEVRAVAPVARIVVVAPPEVAIPQGVERVLEDPPLGGPVAGVAAGLAKMATLPGYRPGALIGLLTCDAPLAPRLYSALERAYGNETRDVMRASQIGEGGQPDQFVGGAVPLATSGPTDTNSTTGGGADVVQPSTFKQYLHGVYVAGALGQLFGAQVRDRSVRSLFAQLRVATVPDAEGVGMDVDTWEDAAVLERRLADMG